MNKRKWADKGIAKARYNDGGTAKVFTFDDFKYEREPLGKMLRDLEATLQPEQIVGGPSEAEADKERASKESAVEDSLEEESAVEDSLEEESIEEESAEEKLD